MSPPGRPKAEYLRSQHEGASVSAFHRVGDELANTIVPSSKVRQ